MSTAYLLDTSSFIHRSYHASKERPTFTKDGKPNFAINLFRNMLERLQRDQKPDYLIACCDVHAPTFRSELYAEYKAQRPTPPEDLISQIDGCMDVLLKAGVPTINFPGYEADDIIGTLAHRIVPVMDVVIVCGDKDMAQLVEVYGEGQCVRVWNTGKNKMLGPIEVFEEYGVMPHQIVDYLSLVGDTSDNVPGCKGIGPKGAIELLKQFGNLDAILNRSSEISSKTYRHAVQNNREMVRLSRKLVTIDCNVPLPDVSNLYSPF